MPETRRIILEGSGGQGLGLGGKILAEAAVSEGLNASQSQSYGAQARGGFSSAEVVISPGEIVYPLVDEPDIVVALTPPAYNRYKDLPRRGGLLLYNNRDTNAACSKPYPGFTSGSFGFPFSKLARETGNPKGITLCALGALVGLTGLVKVTHFEEIIRDNLPPSIAEPNLECFRQGLQLARVVSKSCR